jgi:hypothetical protein
MDCPYLGMTGITAGEVNNIQSTFGARIAGYGLNFPNPLAASSSFPFLDDMNYGY